MSIVYSLVYLLFCALLAGKVDHGSYSSNITCSSCLCIPRVILLVFGKLNNEMLWNTVVVGVSKKFISNSWGSHAVTRMKREKSMQFLKLTFSEVPIVVSVLYSVHSKY